jgi:hypothetical protein
VVNTIYDPSDGDNDVGRHELGLSRLATIAAMSAAQAQPARGKTVIAL